MWLYIIICSSISFTKSDFVIIIMNVNQKTAQDQERAYCDNGGSVGLIRIVLVHTVLLQEIHYMQGACRSMHGTLPINCKGCGSNCYCQKYCIQGHCVYSLWLVLSVGC